MVVASPTGVAWIRASLQRGQMPWRVTRCGVRHRLSCWACSVSLARSEQNRLFVTSRSIFKGHHKTFKKPYLGLPWWRSGWESACQCRAHRLEPWSGKIPHAAEQLGPWATITEPARLEPVLRNKRGPRTAMKSGPRLPQLEKALAQKRRPNTAIINK